MTRCTLLRVSLACSVLLGASLAAVAAPPASQRGTHADLQAQVKAIDAKIAAARTHNTALQSQVAQMEGQNATQKTQLQQRDAEIAALQKRLQAAGAPTSAGSAGH
ncbi:MAG: hypothetical protein EPN36_13125 [Rhodanobacteraceae bacterium]|nr:MAG: hypothetical protein EPN36_13125 [Rhodanobacteraceae bacterium]